MFFLCAVSSWYGLPLVCLSVLCPYVDLSFCSLSTRIYVLHLNLFVLCLSICFLSLGSQSFYSLLAVSLSLCSLYFSLFFNFWVLFIFLSPVFLLSVFCLFIFCHSNLVCVSLSLSSLSLSTLSLCTLSLPSLFFSFLYVSSLSVSTLSLSSICISFLCLSLLCLYLLCLSLLCLSLLCTEAAGVERVLTSLELLLTLFSVFIAPPPPFGKVPSLPPPS